MGKAGVWGLVVMVRVRGRAGECITLIKVLRKIDTQGYVCTSVCMCVRMCVFAHVS